MGELELLFALLFAAVLLVRAADRLRIPYPIVLVLGGLALAFVPGMPRVNMDPHVVLLVFIPPLLMSAGWNSSPQELRAEGRALGLLALLLVLVTTSVVAVAAHWLVDGLSWPAAFMLGAVVAPTDAVAAVATFSTVHVPERVRRLVEGESLINDATGLTGFRVALGAATAGTFSLLDATVEFLIAAIGGAAIGLAVALGALRAIRRQPDVTISVLLTILAAYASYIAAEEVHASGILAAATCGVVAGWKQSTYFDADTRLTANAFWRILVFGLEAMLFVLLGLQLEEAVESIRGQVGTLVAIGVALALLTIVVRMVFALLPVAPGLGLRERVVVGWCGMRGAISLAAALSIATDIPGRDEVVFLTFVVILVTLVGQGLSLPMVVRALRIPSEREWSPEEAIARLEAAQTALDRLDELEDDDRIAEEPLRRLRELYRARFQQCVAVLGGEKAPDLADDARMRYSNVRRDLIRSERSAVLTLRNEGRISQETQRVIERDLDLEEARLR
ncbi:Na+/H+ antiporter [Solirubrobacter sp. CPCC 204708]|uniref:Na+/H+ antiporter n=1 Tax=Solirubrobacter deserti TaxID=2282478 RepID=A0ABT4RFZ7_9ACTN|nr:Na+/H+ antiporter [Solirubrobacter deserti]MBE2318168.1 Na+/H+ antiporter [Solirubrobacter deserti]MDA0137449.1 Na+/H+ antiporter [Solirubrobacter deserti]